MMKRPQTGTGWSDDQSLWSQAQGAESETESTGQRSLKLSNASCIQGCTAGKAHPRRHKSQVREESDWLRTKKSKPSNGKNVNRIGIKNLSQEQKV